MDKIEGRKMETLTIMLPGGKLPAEVLLKVSELRKDSDFDIYLSTAQNMRLYNIEAEELGMIKGQLAELGVVFKRPGLFPVPKVCIGKSNCNLGLVDTDALSNRILEHFADLENVKPKFKIALSGCPAMCSGASLADIGVVATRKGYDVYVGGKGGPRPKVGVRVLRGIAEDDVLRAIREMIEFHQQKTTNKQRMFKLLADPEFPYRNEV